MVRIHDDVYAEPGLTADDQRQLVAAHAAAIGETKRFFGALRGRNPVTLFCRTATCKLAFGAPASAASADDLGFALDSIPVQDGPLDVPAVVVTGPTVKTSRVLTHELVHAEMKAWVPYDSLPTWFNEGMATWMAGEPDCATQPRSSSSDVTMLVDKATWQAYIRAPGATLTAYCAAREEIATWADRLGDRDRVASALHALLEGVARGEPFERAYARTTHE